IKRLKNAGYQLIYISKQTVTEINERGGKITRYAPNIPDKVANVLAGTVDLTARVIADGENRYLSLKTSPYIFGGSRYNFGVDQIPLDKEVFIETLKKAKVKGLVNERGKKNQQEEQSDEQQENQQVNQQVNQQENQQENQQVNYEVNTETPPWEDEPINEEQTFEAQEERPTRKRRSRTS